ncbi:hypothetical protein F5888DRAFT_1800527 [Russula emetica]|nr:hypothetical protein F5888DRAFT_1800527 [Russula emetica]
MLSVIDFALAAPVVVQEHEVRVSVVDAAKDGTATSPLRWYPSDKWPANAADRTNTPPILGSSNSGHWREQQPRQHNPRSRTDSNGSPEPSNPAPPIDSSPPPGPGSNPPSPPGQAPTDEPDLLNPSSPHDDSHALYPALPSDSRLLRLDPSLAYELDSHSSPPPNSQKFKYLSELKSTTTPLTPPQIASSPDESPSSSDQSSAEEYYPSSPDHLSTDESYSQSSSSDQLSTDESHPPTPGPTDNHPPPALTSNPPPRAKRPRPEGELDFASSLSKTFKGKFKRRLSGSVH